MALPTLWEHQRLALERAKTGESLALFFEVGTGKTRATIEILQWHWENKRRKVLIFAPPIVLENWRREILKYSKIPEHRIYVLTGSGKDRARKLWQIRNPPWREYIIITNYESLLMEDLYGEFFSAKFDVLVADESHKLKDVSSKRTKKAIALSKVIPTKYILTGTPVLNSPMDLFGQYKVMLGSFPSINGKKLDSFWAFRATYFYDLNANMPRHNYFPNWKIKDGALEEINKIVNLTSIHVKKKDCLDLPEFVRKRLDVALTSEQKNIYNSLYKDFIAFVNTPDTAECNGVIKVNLALTKGLRLMQIVSGFCQLDDGRILNFKDTEREKVLFELLQSLHTEHKIIVWAVFKENYETIKSVCQILNLEYAELHGGIQQSKKQIEADRFNNDKNCRVMVANPLAGGVGINLVASDVSIYYSRNFSLEGDEQSEARNYRAGSEIHKCVTRIDLVTPNTIDEIVLASLESKERLGARILQVIKDKHLIQNR